MIDRKGEVKVMDFGVARPELDDGITDGGTIVGTAHYLSPEQARAARSTPGATSGRSA